MCYSYGDVIIHLELIFGGFPTSLVFLLLEKM